MTTAALRSILSLTWQQAGQRRRVPVDRPLRIGRHPSMDIVLNDPQVSRQHCTVTPRADGLAIDATSSTNGVVGPRGQVPALVVPPGGWFIVGSTRFEVGSGPAAELAGHSLPPSQRRDRRPRQRGPAPVLFAALGGLAVLVVVVVGIVMVGVRKSGSNGTPTSDAATAAYDRRDASGLLEAFGAQSPTSADLAAVQQVLGAQPAGSHLQISGQRVLDSTGSTRLLLVTYTVSAPEKPASTVYVREFQVLQDGTWSTTVASETTAEDASR